MCTSRCRWAWPSPGETPPFSEGDTEEYFHPFSEGDTEDDFENNSDFEELSGFQSDEFDNLDPF